MQIIYYDDEAPELITKSIFLGGCSTRPGQDIKSWRKDAIKILEDRGFDGIIFCPENKDGHFDETHEYEKTLEWEEKHLNIADCILFWVPRDLEADKNGNIKLPGLTTNVEFGRWESSGKIVLGYPEDAEKVRYLHYYAEKFNVPIGETLTETLDYAIEMLGEGSERIEGERFIPLCIWKTDSFQSWYKAQTEAGNILEHAKLLYNFRPKFKSFVFLWVLNVSIYVTAEKRSKTNEFVLARADISSVLLWRKNDPIEKSEIILIKEFRSPATTSDGFIRELPSGSSSSKDSDPMETAAEEVKEETDFYLDPKRLKFHSARQLAGTLSSHKANFYSAELTDEELTWFKSQKDIAHGNIEDTERTFIEVLSIKDLLKDNNIDWSNLGMILSICNN